MTKITASITTSVDGYITGPNDGPRRGLGEGGPALLSWVFGGPWDYDEGPKGEATGVDKAFLDEAVAKAREAAGDKVVNIMGGANIIRQALASGQVQEFTLIISPITLGAGKRLFDGFDRRIELEHLGVRQSPFATFITYRVKRR